MATFAEVRQALATTIEQGVETELYSYGRITDVAQMPALIVKPLSGDYTVSFSLDASFEFQLYILVSRVDMGEAQDDLDPFVSHCGPDSIRQVLYNNPTLGLPNVDANVYRMDDYGGEFVQAKTPHMGAILKVRVFVDNTELPEVS